MESIELLYNTALDSSEYILPKDLYLNALFFNTASAMGLKNIRIKRITNRGEKFIIPSYFAISFGESGMGKDHSRNLTEDLFRHQFERFEVLAEDFYDANKGTPSEPDKRYLNLSSYFIPVESSEEGIQKAAQTISDMNLGSVNIYTDELADNIGKMDPIFKKLKTAWDTGDSNGSVNVSDGGMNYFAVKNICFNALLFGAPMPFDLDPKKKEKLISAYVSGMVRRAYIYHNNTYKKSENRNLNFEKMSEKDYDIFDEYQKDLRFFLNNNQVITYPQEVWQALRDYDAEKEILREQSHSLIAMDLGSPKKIEKLLGIIATLDLSETITLEHLKYAIEFTERVDSTAEETVEIKPIYQQIYNELQKMDFAARTDIVKSVKNVTLNSLKDEMILVEEYANMLGNSIIKKETKNIIKWKLETLSKTSIENVMLSVNADPNKFQPEGFKKKRGDFFNLYKIVNSDMRYSAGTFKNRYISDENYLKEQNLFIIDVDDGMTIAEAKKLFENWTFLIATTKSHQVPKKQNGEPVTCDRFRIILPTVSTFHLTPKVYSDMYTSLLDSLGVAYDEKCRNASRWYYGNTNGEHWYNEGEMLDIRNFIPDSIENKEASTSLSNYESTSYGGDIDSRIDGSIKWFLQNTADGNRNDMVFRMGMMLKKEVSADDWESILRHVNTCLSSPLSESDMNSTVRSISRR